MSSKRSSFKERHDDGLVKRVAFRLENESERGSKFRNTVKHRVERLKMVPGRERKTVDAICQERCTLQRAAFLAESERVVDEQVD